MTRVRRLHSPSPAYNEIVVKNSQQIDAIEGHFIDLIRFACYFTITIR